MTKITSLQAIAAALLACGLFAAPAQAGPNRTWVSGTGADSGTCAITAPYKTFAFALTQTAAGGEIAAVELFARALRAGWTAWGDQLPDGT